MQGDEEERERSGHKKERELRRLRAIVEANASAAHKRELALSVTTKP